MKFHLFDVSSSKVRRGTLHSLIVGGLIDSGDGSSPKNLGGIHNSWNANSLQHNNNN